MMDPEENKDNHFMVHARINFELVDSGTDLIETCHNIIITAENPSILILKIPNDHPKGEQPSNRIESLD